MAPCLACGVHLLDSSADAPGEVGQVVIRQGEDAAVPGEGGELLLLVGDAGRKRRECQWMCRFPDWLPRLMM